MIFNILDALLTLLQLFRIEVVLWVGEVHSFDAPTHNLLIFLVHYEAGDVRIMVRPLVRAIWNLNNFTPSFKSLVFLVNYDLRWLSCLFILLFLGFDLLHSVH